jgi:hypothetical protein
VGRFVVLLFFVGAIATATAPCAAAQTVVLRPPVDAPVLDPYRPPEIGYGPGNRGIEYDTNVGARVGAAGPGIVVFAGPVAGRTWVTVAHHGGLRTSYGPLSSVAVVTGDTVVGGDWVGSTSGPLHFGTRVDGDYVDPATLLGVRELTVRLVTHQTDDGGRWLRLVELEERRHLVEHAAGGSGFWGLVDRALGVALGAISPFFGTERTFTQHVEAIVHLVELGDTLYDDLDMAAVTARMITGLASILDPEECTTIIAAAAVMVPARPMRRRIAIVIDGLDSSSDSSAMADLDLVRLGYERTDIGRVSYAGGLVPGSGGDWSVDRSEYDASTTRGEVEPQIDLVAQTLRSVAAANPGVPIDVFGHSLGGLIARHAIAKTAHEVPYGIAVTLASPHAGAPLADLVEALEATMVGSFAADIAGDAGWQDMALIAPAVEDLSATGFAGDTSHVAFPESVHAVTIGSRADVIVPATRADAPGARHVIVGGLDPSGAHHDITGLPEVEREVRLALAGLPPACRRTADAILDLVVPESIALAETAVAAGVLVSDLLPS